MMRNMVIAVVGLAVIGLVAYGFWAGGNRPQGSAPTGSERRLAQAPEFLLKDYEGRMVALAQFRGRPVIVNSWAAWCPFCREELVDFAAVKRELSDKIEIIAINRVESLETAKAYTDELGLGEDLILLLDPADSFYQSIGGFSMPETIFVDPEGRIAFHKRGPMTREEIRERIRQAFNL